jgi:hypothetical protein
MPERATTLWKAYQMSNGLLNILCCPETIGTCILNGKVLWYGNYISIKLLSKKKLKAKFKQ